MRRAMLLPVVTLAGGCATTGGAAGGGAAVMLDGAASTAAVALRADGRLEDERATVRLDIASRDLDPIGLEVDDVRLKDPQGVAYAPLGKAQSFVGAEGDKSFRRVPYGAVTIGPRGHTSIELEFDKLPAGVALTLVVPTVYRLGIEGQTSLAAVRLPLRAERREGAPSGHDPTGWFDPFEAW